MNIFESPRRINLNLPISYNRCSLKDMRGIASIMLEMVAQSSPLKPFRMEDFKIAIFFQLTNLEIVEPINPRVPVEEQYYMVRFRFNRFGRFANSVLRRNKPFALYLWQIADWIFSQKDPKTGKAVPGMLDWLDADSKDFFTLLPIEYVKRRRSGFWGILRHKRFKGPEPMLDGFSWQRYRFAQDFMQNYVQTQNHLLMLKKMGQRASVSDITAAIRHLDTAKALFLANLFELRVRYIDESTGHVRTDWHYQSNQSTDNLEYFRNFPDTDWQIILLWWSGIMGWLSKTYPRVFKKQPTKEQKPVNPLELYARMTATMEKYVGLNADEVDREPYTTILQQMEDIARHNEEMEKINKSVRKK